MRLHTISNSRGVRIAVGGPVGPAHGAGQPAVRPRELLARLPALCAGRDRSRQRAVRSTTTATCANYSKLAWSFSGEHVHDRRPGRRRCFAEQIYRHKSATTKASAPLPTKFRTACRTSLPNAGFAFGDRYEIGYRDRGNGWMIGILDGPDATAKQGRMACRRRCRAAPCRIRRPIDPSYTGPDRPADQLLCIRLSATCTSTLKRQPATCSASATT